jgi:hypothetical protein
MDGFIISERRREWLKGDSLATLVWSRARTSQVRISSSFAEANMLASSVLLVISTIASISPSWESCDACACIKCVLASNVCLQVPRSETRTYRASQWCHSCTLWRHSVFLSVAGLETWTALFRGGQYSAPQQQHGYPVCS